MNIELITRDSKNAIRYFKYCIETNKDSYTIRRLGGVFGGKEQTYPPLTISAGKAKRTIKEQLDLELNALLVKQMSKGYKQLDTLTDKVLSELSYDEIDLFLSEDTTDMGGNLKPMLAKDPGKAKDKLFNRHWYASTKLDGVRCMFKWDGERNEVISVSRGGKHYDAATTHLRLIPKLIHLLKERPNLILDGELYHHGMSLQEISGIARLKEWTTRCEVLEFHCYDLAIEKELFQERIIKLDLLRNYFLSDKKIIILEHFPVFGEDEIKKYHDLWVAQGYEGAVLRDPTKEYGFNKRDIRMIKVKEFQDGEFKVIGWEPGLRPEDMVFVLQTTAGVTFKAKPIGDVAQKAQYVKDMDNLIGKKATVKYFYMTADGSPFLPVFKNFRGDE